MECFVALLCFRDSVVVVLCSVLWWFGKVWEFNFGM